MPSYVVTGANRGLGVAFVKHLAAIEGNTVIGIARNKQAAEDRLAKEGVKGVHIFTADITDAKALNIAAEETAKITGGSLDVLINNAGFVSKRSQWKTLIDDTPEGLEQDLMASLHANVVGIALTINAFLPLIREGQQKKVITISSGMADLELVNKLGLAIAAPYSISKAATNALVAKYNAALGESEGILFLALSPGFIDTSEGAPMTEEDMKGGQAMGAKFATYAPHFTGPISPEESIRMQLEVIDKATVQTHGGDFISHLGNKQWL